MTFKEKIAVLENSLRLNDVGVVEIRVEQKPSAPVAPAGLYSIEQPANLIYPLHRLIIEKKDLLVFETYDQNYELPTKGEYVFRSWWILKALEAVCDTDTVWVKKIIPEGEHEHCLLSYEKIGEGGETNEGYFSKKYGWITVDAYNKYILNDILRLRGKFRGPCSQHVE